MEEFLLESSSWVEYFLRVSLSLIHEEQIKNKSIKIRSTV